MDNKKAEVQQTLKGVEVLEGKMKENRARYEAGITEFYDSLAQALEKKKEETIQLMHKGDARLQDEVETWRRETLGLLSQIEGMRDTLEGLSDREVLSQSQSLRLQMEQMLLKAIPVTATEAVSPKPATIGTIMEKLMNDLPSYREVDPKQSLVRVEKEVTVDSEVHAYITLLDTAGFPCSRKQHISVKVVPSNITGCAPVEIRVMPLSSSRYLASFTPTPEMRGCMNVVVDVNQERIESVEMFVKLSPQLLNHPVNTIKGINYRGCLKCVDNRVLCHTRDSVSMEPITVYIDGVTVERAHKLSLPVESKLTEWAPDEIAVGNDSLYISDPLNHMVHQFSLTDGVCVTSFGGKGSETGCFDRPNGLCVAQDGLLYVCDSDNHRIQVFNKHLCFRRKFGEMGTEKGCFLWPSNIASAVAEDGCVQLYVSELHNHRIQCVLSTGKHVQFIGCPGNGEAQLSRPNILHVHRSLLFVSDDRGVIVFTLDGGFVTRFATDLCKVGKYPIEGLTVNSEGFVYVYHCPDNKIFIY